MNAILKIKSDVTRGYLACDWVEDFIDQNRELPGQGLGPNFFTSRPAGSLTAHGYASGELLKFKLTRHLEGNEAVVAFLKEHCRKQYLRDRITPGLRLIMTLDPGEIQGQANVLVDVDQLFEGIAEDTFKTFAREFYGGDEFGFLMGIHHTALVGRGHRKGMFPSSKPRRPRLEARLFVLPKTRQGLPVNLTDQNVLGPDGKPLDLSHELQIHYQAAAFKHASRIVRRPEPAVSQGLRFIAREACLSACEKLEQAPQMQPEERWRYRINQTMSCLKTLDKRILTAHFHKRRKLVETIRTQNKPSVILADIVEKLKGLAGYGEQLRAERETILNYCLTVDLTYEDPLPVELFDINGLRAVLPERHWPHDDQSAFLQKSLRNLHRHRQTSRILAESVKARVELCLAALTPNSLPPWVSYLEEVARSDNYPHQHFLDLKRDSVETSAEV